VCLILHSGPSNTPRAAPLLSQPVTQPLIRSCADLPKPGQNVSLLCRQALYRLGERQKTLGQLQACWVKGGTPHLREATNSGFSPQRRVGHSISPDRFFRKNPQGSARTQFVRHTFQRAPEVAWQRTKAHQATPESAQNLAMTTAVSSTAKPSSALAASGKS
jgi:hypothetical protein